uniref:Nucleolus and neural progenitor protein-like N-terminal domain-containing protein n=1 Tax=Lygus hesperus TaxID=30085 RepID=A0A0A9YYB6_LYGHE
MVSVAIPFWNKKRITPPTTSPKKLFTNGRNVVLSRKISSLRALLSEILTKLDKTNILHKEAAILSRFVYRMKKVFRQDKGFKYIQMLLKTLKNYLSLDLKQVISTLREGCYESYCPSKQMIEWGLVSIMRFAALFHRAHFLSERCASILKERFSTGHHWKLAALCLGIISRVWALADYFVVKSCDWFLNLTNYLSIAVAAEEQWLPADCSLPGDLQSWLGSPAYLTIPFSESKVDDGELNALEKSVGKLKTDSKQDKAIIKPSKPSSSFMQDLPISAAMELDEDVGEEISRDAEAQEKCLKRKEHSKDKLNAKKKRKKVSM